VRLTRCAIVVCAVVVSSGCGKGEGSSGRTTSLEKAPAPERFELGHSPTAGELAALDIDVNSEGKGLPPGQGTASEGAKVYAAKCAVCHGARGEGINPNPALMGREPKEGFPFGQNVKLVHTVGNYWPYATTLYDYVRRAMPFSAPGTMSANEIYSVVAYILAENQIIEKSTVIDAKTLPAVKMPARDKFVPDNRVGGKTFK
jgi:S-disulfanyl-L-cysteine oxidoreductase SoxD